jgi:hypothetical protein
VCPWPGDTDVQAVALFAVIPRASASRACPERRRWGSAVLPRTGRSRAAQRQWAVRPGCKPRVFWRNRDLKPRSGPERAPCYAFLWVREKTSYGSRGRTSFKARAAQRRWLSQPGVQTPDTLAINISSRVAARSVPHATPSFGPGEKRATPFQGAHLIQGSSRAAAVASQPGGANPGYSGEINISSRVAAHQ